jgi:hypothetical protein
MKEPMFGYAAGGPVFLGVSKGGIQGFAWIERKAGVGYCQ